MDALLKIGAETFISENVHFAVKDGFQLLTEFDQIQQAAPTVHLHQQVDVARRVCFSPCHRSKHAHVVCSMLGGQSENFGASGFEDIASCHNLQSIPNPRLGIFSLLRSDKLSGRQVRRLEQSQATRPEGLACPEDVGR